jgi:hypothetical protein
MRSRASRRIRIAVALNRHTHRFPAAASSSQTSTSLWSCGVSTAIGGPHAVADRVELVAEITKR